ncbi:uncharacterized protein LOC103500177 isoform X1 [Cucumis melo]|uniref:Uncharacterized protein LOC103500177 isoform X1 n=1 Tax=Cucumis melo TaxID=3656 RepID=A0ABM3KDV6_CUCME|nr:uncharacterized protein LOC103500177 isoform X1 [Cucumis melo]
MIIIATIFAFALGIVGWIYVALKPPSPKICGTPNGPQVTSPRVKLNDGRHLAYKEFGVPKEKAQYKIILSHGYNASKDMHIAVSQEFMEEVKAYMVIYDRAGYGESDPYPSRSVKTEAFDIEELADKLKLGSKFYVIGCSLGAYPIWGCLKYIPHRLLGACLVVPFVNYWWHATPSALAKRSFEQLPKSFQLTFGIAHHTPWLYYWWTKQKWFPSMMDEGMFTDSDFELFMGVMNTLDNRPEKRRQQGEHESLHRDLFVSFGNWDFDPIEMANPFTHCNSNKSCVQMWQGSADRVVPVELNRFLARKLPWIEYHEIPNAGHMLFHDHRSLEAIMRALLPP